MGGIKLSQAVALAALLTLNDHACRALESITPSEAAGAVSRFLAIANYCPEMLPTDKRVAEVIADKFTILGRSLAPTKWHDVLSKEASRRLVEVNVTGRREWCEGQRRYLREIGEPKVFP